MTRTYKVNKAEYDNFLRLQAYAYGHWDSMEPVNGWDLDEFANACRDLVHAKLSVNMMQLAGRHDAQLTSFENGESVETLTMSDAAGRLYDDLQRPTS